MAATKGYPFGRGRIDDPSASFRVLAAVVDNGGELEASNNEIRDIAGRGPTQMSIMLKPLTECGWIVVTAVARERRKITLATALSDLVMDDIAKWLEISKPAIMEVSMRPEDFGRVTLLSTIPEPAVTADDVAMAILNIVAKNLNSPVVNEHPATDEFMEKTCREFEASQLRVAELLEDNQTLRRNNANLSDRVAAQEGVIGKMQRELTGVKNNLETALKHANVDQGVARARYHDDFSKFIAAGPGSRKGKDDE